VGADPLSGEAPLSLALEDSSRFLLRYDAWTHRLTLSPRADARQGWAVVRATYYGKFADRDSLWLTFEGTGVRAAEGAGPGRAWRLPAVWSRASGALPLRAASSPAPGAPNAQPDGGVAGNAGGGTWTLLTPKGERVASLALPGDGSETAWDGRDGRGRPVDPARYLWAERGARGALVRAGSLRILP
jgi:hypothetical protein